MGRVVAKQAKLNLPAICPIGFIFIWVDKAVLSDVVYLMEKWKYNYVENLTWVQMAPHNKRMRGTAPYMATSHRTLMLFRRIVPEGLPHLTAFRNALLHKP